MTESETDDSSVRVRTTVPAYQREEWDTHAEELGMSRSEFVRSMVQAGRTLYERGDESLEAIETTAASDQPETPEKLGSSDVDPRGDGLETAVVDTLDEHEYLSWDELVDVLTEDLEGRLEGTLQELQSADRVVYSGPNGGYTLDE
jgi:hypothetical protein